MNQTKICAKCNIEKSIIEFDFNGKHYYAGQNIAEMEFQDFISIEYSFTLLEKKSDKLLAIVNGKSSNSFALAFMS